MTLKKVYSKIRTAIIYEIICLTTGERYIGSSVRSLKTRISDHYHQKDCKSKTIIERDNYKENILETFETRFLLPILLKEQYYIDNTENINERRALDLYKKISNKNRKIYSKQYAKDNKDILNKKRNINYKKNPEKSKERSRNFRKNNPEKVKEYRNKSREKNNKQLCVYRSKQPIIVCECGSQFKKYNKYYHLQTIKHKKYLDTL